MNRFDVWDYFDKCDDGDVNKKRGQCKICSKIILYTATIHNLKNHLRCHNIYVSKRPGSVKKSLNHTIWGYFTIKEGSEKQATCNECEKELSYKTTSANLKSHLRVAHPSSYNRMLKNLPPEDETLFLYSDAEYLEEEDTDEDQQSSLWNYFERESGGNARCAVCCASVHASVKDLREHLQKSHPKLLDDGKDSEDIENSQNDDVYTEVIYLEDPPSKERVAYVNKTPRPKRRSTNSADGSVKRPRFEAKEDDEIESFGNYLICLLKKLPSNACMKVQRDIINLVMNAKFASEPNDTAGNCYMLQKKASSERAGDVPSEIVAPHSFTITLATEDSEKNVVEEKVD